MAIAEVDNTGLIQALLGAVTGKSGTTSSTGTTTENKTGTQNVNQVLQQLINSATTGSTTTAGSTSTSQTQSQSGSQVSTTKSDITAEGIHKMLIDALSAAGSGVADIAQGSHVAGIYNSSVQELLTNDLLSKTAGELAKLQAGTTTTTTNTGTNTVSGSTNTNQNTATSQNTSQTANTNNQQTTTSNQNTTGTNAQNTVATQESPLSNVDWGSLLGTAAGGSLLLPILGELLKGTSAAGTSAASGLSGLLSQLLGNNSGISVDTGGAGTNNSGLTPQQMEALVGSLGGGDNMNFDFNSWLNDIGIGSTSGPDTAGASTGDWWDPTFELP